MLIDKRVIECEEFVRRRMVLQIAMNGGEQTDMSKYLSDTAEALAELLRWRERAQAKAATVRLDQQGRDVSDLPGLWDESDTLLSPDDLAARDAEQNRRYRGELEVKG